MESGAERNFIDFPEKHKNCLPVCCCCCFSVVGASGVGRRGGWERVRAKRQGWVGGHELTCLCCCINNFPVVPEYSQHYHEWGTWKYYAHHQLNDTNLDFSDRLRYRRGGESEGSSSCGGFLLDAHHLKWEENCYKVIKKISFPSFRAKRKMKIFEKNSF